MKKSLYIAAATLTAMAVFFLYASLADASNTVGPDLPTAAVDLHNGDGWTNPTNIENDNLNYAVGISTTGGAGSTGDLEATGYGFSVPTGATVLGILYTVKRQTNCTGSNAVGDYTISLIKAGVITGTNKASAANWVTATTTISYGGANDLWGLALAPSDVNASNFGADIEAGLNGALSCTTGMNVYYIKLSVTYSFGSARVTITKSKVVVTGGIWTIP